MTNMQTETRYYLMAPMIQLDDGKPLGKDAIYCYDNVEFNPYIWWEEYRDQNPYACINPSVDTLKWWLDIQRQSGKINKVRFQVDNVIVDLTKAYIVKHTIKTVVEEHFDVEEITI